MALWSKPAGAATTTTAARSSLWRQWWWLLPLPVARTLKRLLLRVMALWLNSPLRRLRIGNRAASPQLTDDRDVGAMHFASDGDVSTAAAQAHDSHTIATVGGAVGLVNMGNTCFVNATLQCLAVLPAFQASIAQAIDTLQHTQQERDATQQLRLHAVTTLLSLLQLLAPVESPDSNDHDNENDEDENDSDAYSTPEESDASEQHATYERAVRKRRRCDSESHHTSSRTSTTATVHRPVPDRETLSSHVRAFLDATRACTDLLAKKGAAQEQQDAEEFLSFLLELLHELLRPVRSSAAALDAHEVAYFREGEAFYARELAKCHPLEPRTYTDVVSGLGDLRWQRFLKQSDSVVTDLFVGQIVRGSQCCSCANLTCLHQELRVLSLSVNASASSQSLASCLAAHRHAEHLVDDNRVFCEGHCHMKTSRVTQVLFQRAPPVLVVQLQRFKQSAWGQSLEKIRTAVTFPIGSRHGATSDELLDLTDNMFVRNDAQRVRYELVGVCAHVGASINSGHYVAYVRQNETTTRTSTWLRLDDDVVAVLDDARFRDETLASAYILFYAQVTD